MKETKVEEADLKESGEEVEDCGICGQSFDSETELSRHLWTHQAITPQTSTFAASKLYKCAFCLWELPPSRFSQHASIHFSEIFVPHYEQSQLIKTEAVIPEIRNFMCCLCRKQFRTNETLRRHFEERHDGKGTLLLAID